MQRKKEAKAQKAAMKEQHNNMKKRLYCQVSSKINRLRATKEEQEYLDT